MPQFTLDGTGGFLTKIKGDGFSKPYLFQVTLVGNEEIRFFAKTASIPSQAVTMIEIPFQGRKVKLPTEKTFQEWTLTVINDENYKMRKFFENWLQRISINPTGLRKSDSTLDTLLQDIQIHQLGTDGEIVVTYQLIGAFPTNLSQMDLNWESTNITQDFTVTFAYQYYKSELFEDINSELRTDIPVPPNIYPTLS